MFLVPGGFVLGGALAARRAGKAISDASASATGVTDEAAADIPAAGADVDGAAPTATPPATTK
ncbi:MAG: hypothetical protein BVN32_09650 [Proteobacteria bacterium ST_bin14]|nr:MAG: hypothetical protein BVN32_09650 [Proteobacteria bacterium ST_bin14]